MFVKFNLECLLRGDYVSRMNGYATARQNGWMSANDIRALENLDLIPPEAGGDLYLVNGNSSRSVWLVLTHKPSKPSNQSRSRSRHLMNNKKKMSNQVIVGGSNEETFLELEPTTNQ